MSLFKGEKLSGGLALVCIVLALLATLVVSRLSRDVQPDEAQMDAIAQALRKTNAPVLVHPPWRDDVVAKLRARLQDRDIRLAAKVRQGRVPGPLILLRVGSSPGPLAVSQLPVEQKQRYGDMQIEFLGRALQAENVDDLGHSLLVDNLKNLQVRISLPDREIVCDDFRPLEARYHCPGLREWNYVGVIDLEIGGQARHCLWAHPISNGKVVITTPWPKAKTLTFWHGLADTAAKAPGGSSVFVDVFAGERRIQRVEQKNKSGFDKILVKLGAAGADQQLRFEISTPDDGARHFCIDARANDTSKDLADNKGTQP